MTVMCLEEEVMSFPNSHKDNVKRSGGPDGVCFKFFLLVVVSSIDPSVVFWSLLRPKVGGDLCKNLFIYA